MSRVVQRKGNQRVVCKFAWLPTSVQCTVYWFDRYYVVQSWIEYKGSHIWTDNYKVDYPVVL